MQPQFEVRAYVSFKEEKKIRYTHSNCSPLNQAIEITECIVLRFNYGITKAPVGNLKELITMLSCLMIKKFWLKRQKTQR